MMNNLPNTRFRKYDVAISYAHQDEKIALAMYAALKSLHLKVYAYQRKNQWSNHLDQVTREVYYHSSNYILVVLSKNYVKNEWTCKEWQTIQKGLKDKNIHSVFILRLDLAVLSTLSAKEIYEPWKNNPKELAKKMKAQMSLYQKNTVAFLLFFILIVGVYIYLYNSM